jgi:hypothetical protein
MAQKKEIPYYSVNHEKRTVVVDFAVTPTKADEKYVEFLIKGGYQLKPKSQKRATKAKERADKDIWNNAKIIEELQNHPDDLKEYERIKKLKQGGGYFKAKWWFLDKYHPEARTKKKK